MHPARVPWPDAARLGRDHPEARIELSPDGRLSDLAEDRFDCAIRLGEHPIPGMIAMPAGPPIAITAFASPDGLSRRRPRHPDDPATHDRLPMRRRVDRPLCDREFASPAGEEIVCKRGGPFILANPDMVLTAARVGCGIGDAGAPEIKEDFAAGRPGRARGAAGRIGRTAGMSAVRPDRGATRRRMGGAGRQDGDAGRGEHEPRLYRPSEILLMLQGSDASR